MWYVHSKNLKYALYTKTVVWPQSVHHDTSVGDDEYVNYHLQHMTQRKIILLTASPGADPGGFKGSYETPSLCYLRYSNRAVTVFLRVV